MIYTASSLNFRYHSCFIMFAKLQFNAWRLSQDKDKDLYDKDKIDIITARNISQLYYISHYFL